MFMVTVRIPASTSNLGPGFDCLGVGLRLYNTVTVGRAGKHSTVPEILNAAARLFFDESGVRPFRFHGSITGHIPRSRGLGSSATIRAGALLALNRIANDPLDRLSILRLCTRLEGHPDNSAPAIFGGFTVVREETVQRFKVSPRLYFVLLVPDFEIKTAAARKILPARIPRRDAVENCRNASAITAAFASGNYQALAGAFVDKLHQPFRTKLIPFLPRAIAAATKAGALGAFLSGSGSTIAALTLNSPDRVGAAMLGAARPENARVIITTADNRGAQFSKIRNPKFEIRNS
jgi:homoserine kinase